MAVIVIHCIAPVVGTRNIDSASWTMGNLTDSSVRWAVPLFIMISGSLLIKATSYTKLSSFYRKRAARMLIPLLFWPVLYGLWYISGKAHIVDISDFLRASFEGKPLGGGHLYFLFLISGLYAITPFVSAFVSVVSRKQAWIASIAILVASSCSLHLSQIFNTPMNYNIFTYFIPYIGYFILGYMLTTQKNLVQTRILLMTFIFTSIGIALLTSISIAHFKGFPFYEYTSVPVIILSISVFLLIQRLSTPLKTAPKALIKAFSSLSGNSFGIYLIHVIILDSLIALFQLNETRLGVAFLLIAPTLILSWVMALAIAQVPFLRRILT